MERIRSEPLPPITLPGGAGVVELRRSDDAFFCKAAELSMPIQLQGVYTLADRSLRLPEIYAALTTLTGPSGDLYDDWKGAFSFPFKLTVRRGDRESRYLLNLRNFRSMVEPTLYRVQQPGESYRSDRYHAPFDDELSADDITHVIDSLRRFLAGFVETMPKWTTPFVKQIRSNALLFGYDPRSGAFFEEGYREPEAYRAALERWHTIIPEETPEQKRAELDW
jgi:hypothetical protein